MRQLTLGCFGEKKAHRFQPIKLKIGIENERQELSRQWPAACLPKFSFMYEYQIQ